MKLLVALTILAAAFAAASQSPDDACTLPAVISPDLPDQPPRADLDPYGGWTGLKGKPTGFFHVEQVGGRYWLITPDGNVYFMLECNWAGRNAVPHLKSWGFNAAEADSGLPYTRDVKFFRSLDKPLPIPKISTYPPWVTFPDVFDPAWPDICRKRAEEVLGPHANDPLMIGYQLDNEIALDGWYEAVLHTEPGAPCRAAFVEVAREYYAARPDDLATDWAAFNVTKVEDLAGIKGDAPNIPGLVTAWYAVMAERAFGVASAAAKAVASNHLNLGTRLINAPLPSPPILQAMGKYFDVISLNLYSMFGDRLMTQLFTVLPAVSALTGRPTLVSEFSYRGNDTLHPNTQGALPTVKTQAERAIGYMSYVSAVASLPSHLGVSWYKYADDDPRQPMIDYSEDCNFGLVDLQHRPYSVLTETARLINSHIYDIAADPVRNETCSLFYRTELARWDRPGDELLFQKLLDSKEPFVDPLAQLLPEPRRWHQHYWIRHKSPRLIINDDRFSGWCQANVIEQNETGTTLALINVQALTMFPRALWYGPACERPDETLTLWSNAQYLLRQLDAQGRLVRMPIADGSFARTVYDVPDLRVDCRTPYLDMCFDPGAKTLALTVRGSATAVGLAGLDGWKASWNGKNLDPATITKSGPLSVYSKEP